MNNGDYMIIIRGYFDKYSFYVILLTVWVIGLMYLSLISEGGIDQINKVVCF